ncbi:hypothetical protein [Verrucomicrobium sp. BvORR106]|uniref:hypothetical protein n=1 Tax=Verrucomicrobium sp. BvORR106 TaxID=1403819 RepID=UPI00056ECB39|nr:hypothetical protein [Verrucomicrobium sp. BvORR106]
MPCTLARLPCGVIYTEAFSQHLARVHAEQAPHHPKRVMTFEYVRCASGPMRGRAWCQVLWLPDEVVPDYRRYRMGRITVHFPKSSQHGLRERCLDYLNDRVVVRP